MARSNRKEKAAIFNARALITHEIMRSRDVQCNTGNDLKYIPTGRVWTKLALLQPGEPPI